MPTVLRQNGFQVRIYTDDHFPPHVHVVRGGGLIIIYLDGENGKNTGDLWVRESHELSRRDERQALDLVAANYELLKGAWEAIHG